MKIFLDFANFCKMSIDRLPDLFFQRFQVRIVNKPIPVKRRVHSHQLIIDDLALAVQLVQSIIPLRIVVPRSSSYRDCERSRQNLLELQ